MIRRKVSIRNMISRNLVKEIVSIMENLVTLVKTANKNPSELKNKLFKNPSTECK